MVNTLIQTKDRIKMIPTSKIEPNPNQPRRIFDEAALGELAESIKQCGLIQPITVRRTRTAFRIIAGERRWRACKMAGVQEIPCIINDSDEKQSSIIALAENMQRRDLDVFEEAEGIRRMIELFGVTQEEAAQRLGKSQSSVANKLRLLKLDERAIRTVREKGLTERHARALLKLSDGEQQYKAAVLAAEGKWNVAQTEEYVDGASEGGGVIGGGEEKERVKSEKKPSPKRIFLIKDLRVLANSLMHAVTRVKDSGIDADIKTEEQEDTLMFTITVKKAKK